MQKHARAKHIDYVMSSKEADAIAEIYSRAGDRYMRYADGDTECLFSFDGLHSYADRRLWGVLEHKLNEVRAEGRGAITILDAGCGPGTWLRRCVTHAHRLGFSQIAARGFDAATKQIETARRKAADLAALPGIDLKFDVADINNPLPEADSSVDFTLCLYSVLNHLPVSSLPRISREFARVTRTYFITTVRAIGSSPTAFVETMEDTRHLRLDHRHNRCEVELCNGRRIDVGFHLFSTSELLRCFSSDFDIEELRGLDIFHSRFRPDRRWNPPSIEADQGMLKHLALMEEAHACDPHFIEWAMHLMLTARPGAGSINSVFGGSSLGNGR
jgi:SAM-dependent methyltransferase